MKFSGIEIREYAHKLGKGERTLRRWVKEGCNLRDPKSVREWVVRNEIRQTPIERARRRKRDEALKAAKEPLAPPQERVSVPGNGETLAPVGKRGAAAALQRLENQEEESHRRLERAQAGGNPVTIQAAQEFWLRCSESLRRLDLAIEASRREQETLIPLAIAQNAIIATAEWLRISTLQFLSSEAVPLMGFKDPGEFKNYFLERFCGILKLTVKNASKTNSAIPLWAEQKIKEAWNVE